MKFSQIAKRYSLLIVVNLLIITTISIILSLLPIRERLGGNGFAGLMVFCFVWGMGGAFISLAISRWMAKKMMGVQVIDPNTTSPELRRLVDTVENLARSAGIPMPEVGIYDSPEINAFATGPSKSRSLVAVSSGLLHNMRQAEVEGVLAHEIAHVANGDMVTMTLVQGVINAFVMFLARALAFVLTQNRDRDGEERGGGMAYFLLVMVFQIVFSILGSMVVCWFSRWREFRADAGGARVAGRERMIAALRALKTVHEHGADQVGEPQPAFQSLKISGKTSTFAMLLATHPPLEERIARLENSMF